MLLWQRAALEKTELDVEAELAKARAREVAVAEQIQSQLRALEENATISEAASRAVRAERELERLRADEEAVAHSLASASAVGSAVAAALAAQLAAVGDANERVSAERAAADAAAADRNIAERMAAERAAADAERARRRASRRRVPRGTPRAAHAEGAPAAPDGKQPSTWHGDDDERPPIARRVSPAPRADADAPAPGGGAAGGVAQDSAAADPDPASGGLFSPGEIGGSSRGSMSEGEVRVPSAWQGWPPPLAAALQGGPRVPISSGHASQGELSEGEVIVPGGASF